MLNIGNNKLSKSFIDINSKKHANSDDISPPGGSSEGE